MTTERAAPSAAGRRSTTARWADAVISARPHPSTVASLTLVATLVVAVGDHLSGPYLVFAPFYLLAVGAGAWFVGRRFALLLGVLSAVAGFTATALRPEELDPSIYTANEVLRLAMYTLVAVLAAAVRRATAEVEDLATVDPLTRLLTRRRFFEQAALDFARARRSGVPLAVVYVDLDDLKHVNDTQGHAAGDRLLADFAEAARATFRSTDVLGRVGGDELCFVLPEADDASANEAVYRLRRHLDHTYQHEVRFSAGVLSGVVPPELDVASAVHQADLLMMEAKEMGKNRSRAHTGFDMPPAPAERRPTP